VLSTNVLSSNEFCRLQILQQASQSETHYSFMDISYIFWFLNSILPPHDWADTLPGTLYYLHHPNMAHISFPLQPLTFEICAVHLQQSDIHITSWVSFLIYFLHQWHNFNKHSISVTLLVPKFLAVTVLLWELWFLFYQVPSTAIAILFEPPFSSTASLAAACIHSQSLMQQNVRVTDFYCGAWMVDQAHWVLNIMFCSLHFHFLHSISHIQILDSLHADLLSLWMFNGWIVTKKCSSLKL
jgi:hypothetical protein